MSPLASQITWLTIVYSTVYPGADQRKHQSSASLPFVRGTHRWPMNSPHKGPVTRKCFHFVDVIMEISSDDSTDGVQHHSWNHICLGRKRCSDETWAQISLAPPANQLFVQQFIHFLTSISALDTRNLSQKENIYVNRLLLWHTM